MKILRILTAFLMLSMSAFALEEGKDYVILQKSLDVPKNSIVKVFSYACPHCYKFDKTVTLKILNALEGVQFIQYHLKTKGALGESASKIFAAMIQIDEENGVNLLDDDSKFKKAKFALYKATHDKKDDFDNGKDKDRFFKTILAQADVSKSEYEKHLANPKTQEILKTWDASYDVAVIGGVPAIVVGGKYLVNFSSIGSVDNLIAVIKELLEK